MNLESDSPREETEATEVPADSNRSEFRKLVLHLFGPIIEFFKACGKASDPKQLVTELRSHPIISVFNAKLILGALMISTIIAQVFRYDSGELITGITIVDEILFFFIIITLHVCSGAVFQIPLKLMGGTGPLRDTVMASIYTTMVVYPLATLIEALCYVFLGEVPRPVAFASSYGALLFFAQVMPEVHGLTKKQVGIAIAVTVAILAAIGFIILLSVHGQ